MKKIVFILLTLICVTANAQNKIWEIGVGGSYIQYNQPIKRCIGCTTRTTTLDKTFYLPTANIYLAKELSNVFTLDIQGNYGQIDNNHWLQGGLGLQYRFGYYMKSRTFDPYVRIGGNYINKQDYNEQLSPVSIGVGTNVWITNRIGVGIQADYLHHFTSNITNHVQASARLTFRLGKNHNDPGCPRYRKSKVEYIDRPVYIDKIIEKTVEIVKVDTVVIEKIIVINNLIQSLNFDFDSYTLKPEHTDILNQITTIIYQSGWGKRYLITGHTDSKGTQEYNLQLSWRRALAIKDYLVIQGVPVHMLKAKGVGKSSAYIQGESDYVREGERKVLIEIITNSQYWDKL